MLFVRASVLAFATLAIPAAVARTGQAITVNQKFVAQPQKPQSPADLMLKTYRKYAKMGAKPPADLLHAAAQQEGSAVLTPSGDGGYYAIPVTAGGEVINLDLDTGASDLWMFSTLLPANVSANHSLYDPTKSPTAKLLQNYNWTIQYGDFELASGVVYTDTVEIGGVTATSQAIEAATSVSSSFLPGSRNGLLGLAYTQLNSIRPVKQKTFFETVKPTLEQKLFTADLKNRAPGSFDFGIINSSKYTNEIVYTPVNSSTGLWLFSTQGYKIGNQSTVYSTGDIANPDSSGSLLWIPAQVASTYYAEVPDATNYMNSTFIVPCNSTLPDFHIMIGDGQFTVPGSYINYVPFSGYKEGYCVGGLQAATGYSTSIFGDVFMKSVFAVFDQTQAQPRIGFANKTLSA